LTSLRLSSEEKPKTATTYPSSPAALALRVSHGRWHLTRHLALLDWALVQLADRWAPKAWLYRYFPHSREWLDARYPDQELVPFRRLVVEMPPRHGKSELVSRWFPAWYLGRHPEQRVILTSYAAEFARTWGRRARDVLREHGEQQFGVRVKHQTEAANDWELEGGDGGMLTAGVGGPITGRGADAFVSDDAVKNAEEAASPTIQARNAEWWDSTASTRFEPDAIALVMATRWHQADMTGHILAKQQALLAEDGDKDIQGRGGAEDEFWFVLRLPALAEEDDVLGREPEQALWPARFPVPSLERIKLNIGSYFFGALYQQDPTPSEGGLIPRQWWQRYHVMPVKTERGGIFIDTATDDEIGQDFTAIATWRTSGLEFYVERVVNARLAFPDQVRAVLDAVMASRSSEDGPGLPVYIEETPWALPLIKTLRSHISQVIGVKPGGHSKVARAMAATPYIEAKSVFVPDTANWVGDFIEQHAGFPHALHDDMVDTTSLALHVLGTRARVPVMAAASVTYAPSVPQPSGNEWEWIKAAQAARRQRRQPALRRGGI
jgi:predicted phage terminase large subunit-like protein